MLLIPNFNKKNIYELDFNQYENQGIKSEKLFICNGIFNAYIVPNVYQYILTNWNITIPVHINNYDKIYISEKTQIQTKEF